MSIETNAAGYRKVGALLTEWGWGPYIEWWPGWATRTNSGAIMPPQGVTVHHTGGVATATSYMVNPRDRPQLKVLANVHITAQHFIRFIAAGGASHGGYTHKACYDRIIDGTAPLDRDLVPGADSATFSINKRTVGIEIDGAGGPNEWDTWTYRAAVAVSAACQVAGGWPVDGSPRVGAHKEHTRRKPGDPYANMGKFRTDVLACIREPWGPDATPPVLGSRVLSKNGNDRGPDVAELAGLLTARNFDVGKPLDEFGPAMDAAVRAVQLAAGLRMTGVVDAETLAAIKAPAGSPAPTPAPAPTPTPVPTPAPVPAPVVALRVATLNCQGYGRSATAARMKALAKVVVSFDAPLVALSECTESMRDKLRGYLPGGTNRWKVWSDESTPYAAILFDVSVVSYGSADDVKVVRFGTANAHGAVVARFEVEGIPVAFGAYHLQPNTIASLAAQTSQVRHAMRAAEALDGFAVIAGDGVNNNAWLPGWTDCRTAAKTAPGRKAPTYKAAITDRIHVLTTQPGYTYRVVGYGTRKTTASDHRGVVVEISVTPVSTS